MHTRRFIGAPRGFARQRLAIVAIAVVILSSLIGAQAANAQTVPPANASTTSHNRGDSATSHNGGARPLDASGCTSANSVIQLCIFVKGSNNLVAYVDAQKNYSIAYVNACDSVSLLVNGRVYLTSGRWCSPAGTYLSHRFNLNENFSDGDQICTRWDSYPNYLPCETVY